ncbi:MAG: glycosyltransferase family 4 protein [Halobacteriota archaeon]
MGHSNCRILFVTSFDVRLIDSIKTDGSMYRLLKDFVLKYEDMCELFLFTGDTNECELAPSIKHVPCGLFQKFGLWHASYAILSVFKIAKRLKGNALVRGFSAACPAAIVAAKVKAKPSLVFYEYNWAYQVKHVNKGKVFGALAQLIEDYVIRNADVVVTRNASLENEVRQRGAKRVVIIPLTFDEQIFKPGIDVTELKKAYCIRNEKVLMFIGRLHPVKRLDLLLQAAAKLNEDFKLFIVGTGVLEGELRKTAQSLGISDKVIFTGAVHYSDVPRYMNMADLIVMTSSIEGQPRVLIEAMSCGTPAVGTAVFGIKDTIEEGVTGYLTSDDPTDIADKITKALANVALPQTCRSVSLEKYSNEACALKEKMLCKELLHLNRT